MVELLNYSALNPDVGATDKEPVAARSETTMSAVIGRCDEGTNDQEREIQVV